MRLARFQQSGNHERIKQIFTLANASIKDIFIVKADFTLKKQNNNKEMVQHSRSSQKHYSTTSCVSAYTSSALAPR